MVAAALYVPGHRVAAAMDWVALDVQPCADSVVVSTPPPAYLVQSHASVERVSDISTHACAPCPALQGPAIPCNPACVRGGRSD